MSQERLALLASLLMEFLEAYDDALGDLDLHAGLITVGSIHAVAEAQTKAGER